MNAKYYLFNTNWTVGGSEVHNFDGCETQQAVG